ncbi:MAG: type VI secretion system baseplate subunit TssF [Methylococcaceae bacterium]|jgi:type VI secretion system protein ImpG
MDELLPYYERELGFLKRYSREFAARYPKIAGRLLMGGEVCEDPHIERMIQSFALLSSRISKRLDDDYPEFTEALFEVLYPHYLRPFPSCSIAKFDYAAAAAQLTSASVIKRGTELVTRPVKGVTCKFKTVYDVPVVPVKLTNVNFNVIANAPEATILPIKATSTISIKFEITSEQLSFPQLKLDTLRLFIDGESSFCAALRDTLFMQTLCAYVEVGQNKRWLALSQIPLNEVGFDSADGLIPFSSRSHPAYRLLTEYFAFPEKFNFFDIDIAAINRVLPESAKAVTLHLVLSGLRADSNRARILANLSGNNLLLGCTPVINLFKQRGDPIRITHTAAHYPVVADARRAYAYEVYSINSVKLVRQTTQGESVTEFRPFYSLRHAETSDVSGHYWVAHRDEMVAIKSPGYETEISIVDIDFNPAEAETQTLSLDLTCCNRNLPSLLTYGLPGGDLFLEGGAIVSTINFLRKPSTPQRFERNRGAQWRLISHLSLNHLSLSSGGLEAFQEILRLYDLTHSASTQRLITGITGITSQAVNTWLPGNPFAALVRGVEVRLTIDEASFVGSGIHVFARVIDHYLGLYVNANSFTQLVVISHKTGEELLKCMPRSGEQSLV